MLDASALLAYLHDEPGSETIDFMLDESAISSVNWTEVVQKSIAGGVMSMACAKMWKPWAQHPPFHLVSGRLNPSLIDEANSSCDSWSMGCLPCFCSLGRRARFCTRFRILRMERPARARAIPLNARSVISAWATITWAARSSPTRPRLTPFYFDRLFSAVIPGSVLVRRRLHYQIRAPPRLA